MWSWTCICQSVCHGLCKFHETPKEGQKKTGKSWPVENLFFPNQIHSKWLKMGFLKLLKDLVIIIFMNLADNVYIICNIPVQIPYLWRIWFWKYGSKCTQPIRLQDFWIEWNEIAWIFASWYQVKKIDLAIFGWALSKIGVTTRL